ncbi:MAG: GDSL-type esterase/lipase family protein [Planctomycetota bacterium]|nr:GDSL-type esterase/lipase family protein [Planctomycetota bacterium]
MKKAQIALTGFALTAVLFGLWRVDVIPGVWDLQHWGEDVAGLARAEREAHREARLAGFEAEAAGLVAELAADPELAPIALFGSSTIERFPAAELLPGTRFLNRGIGDEPAGLLAERLEISLPPEAWPRCAGFVLYLGSVDVRRLGAGPDAVAERAARILRLLERHAPGKPTALLGLLPERGLGAERRAVIEATNASLAELAAAPEWSHVTFVPTDRAPLRGPGGELSADHSVDRLHLNELGYQVLAQWIRLEGGPLAALL